MIGHETFGTGPREVVVLNDWLCDTSTWDDARRYLDTTRWTWIFADLRGYGRSREQRGAYSVEEAAADVLALMGARGAKSFEVVGHSMSTLVALHLAQQWPERVARAVLLTPPPPTGFGVDDKTLAAMQAMARGDDTRRASAVGAMTGGRLSVRWVEYKVERWRATSEPEAVAGYVAMFARDGLPDAKTPIRVPVLAITGEQDGETMRRAAAEAALAPLCERLTVSALAQCGHYPMQEVPPLLATLVQRFLDVDALKGGG